MIYRIHKKKTLKHVNPVMPFAALPAHTAVTYRVVLAS
jgi:hypothetical protein